MTDDDIELGPIDYVVVEWPADRQPTGEAFPHLVDLVDRGMIRVLDFAFVHKEMDGSVVGINIGDLDLDGNPEIAVFEGASSALSVMTTTARRGRGRRRGARPRRPCTRTRGPHRSRPRCVRAGRSSSRTARSRSTPSSPRSTNSSPRTRRARPRRRDDMPGLIRGVARTAVIAGTATSVSIGCRVARRPLVTTGSGSAAAAVRGGSGPRRPPGRARTRSSSSSRSSAS